MMEDKLKITDGNYKDTFQIYHELSKLEQKYIDDENFKESPCTICRKVLYLNENPISFVEIIKKPEENIGYVVAATNLNFRKRGYTKLLFNQIEKEMPNDIEKLIWLYRSTNEISPKVATALGFKKVKNGMFRKEKNVS